MAESIIGAEGGSAGQKKVTNAELLEQLNKLADMLRSQCFELVQKRTERTSNRVVSVPGVLFSVKGNEIEDNVDINNGIARVKAWTSVWDRLATAYIIDLAAAGMTNREVATEFPGTLSFDLMRDLLENGAIVGLNGVKIRQEEDDYEEE